MRGRNLIFFFQGPEKSSYSKGTSIYGLFAGLQSSAVLQPRIERDRYHMGPKAATHLALGSVTLSRVVVFGLRDGQHHCSGSAIVHVGWVRIGLSYTMMPHSVPQEGLRMCSAQVHGHIV